MGEFVAPTYELVLDTSEKHDGGVTQIASVGIGQSVTLKCSVSGDLHKKPDLTWLKNGGPIEQATSLKITRTENMQTINIGAFDEKSHTGLYVCSVRRRDNKYQSRKMRVQRKLTDMELADGFIRCAADDKGKAGGRCLNGGICMQHKASKSISCLCPQSHRGARCELTPSLSSTYIGENYQLSVALFGLTIFALIFGLFGFAFLYLRQKRKTGKHGKALGRLDSYDIEMTEPLKAKNYNNANMDFADSTAIKSIQKPNYCWNCGYSQNLIGGKSYEMDPNFPLTASREGFASAVQTGKHEQKTLTNTETSENQQTETQNNRIRRVASLAALPSFSLGRSFFRQFEPRCDQCLAQLRAHFYPDSIILEDSALFNQDYNGKKPSKATSLYSGKSTLNVFPENPSLSLSKFRGQNMANTNDHGHASSFRANGLLAGNNNNNNNEKSTNNTQRDTAAEKKMARPYLLATRTRLAGVSNEDLLIKPATNTQSSPSSPSSRRNEHNQKKFSHVQYRPHKII